MDDVVARARGGSREAFADLVRGHQGRIRAYLRRFILDPHAADDLAQEVFLTAYRALGQWDGRAPLDLWLLGMAKNRALRYLRDEERREAHLTHGLDAFLARGSAERMEHELTGDVDQDRLVEALRRCIQTLPAKSSEMVAAFYSDRVSAAELARRTGQKESAVRMTLLRIRQALRECMRRKISSREAIA